METVEVEIWSDVVCPWCYIGKRRFETALARFEHAGEVVVRWRSFELDPGAPVERTGGLAAWLGEKYGASPEQVRTMDDRVATVAAGEGLTYHLASARPGNTFDAHRLIHLAATHGLADQMKERLMAAYFVEGAPIGDRTALVALAGEIGLDPEVARAALEGDAFGTEVRADEAQARTFGLTGVPSFVVDGRYAISGAEDAERLLDLLQRAWAERQPGEPVVPAAGSAGSPGPGSDRSGSR
ncbi:MAG TPA: DsbA family oxidoreductase [Acidimicrobiales bacterium]|nr:DsbA family oxidoreductase [Acidimicrobiales bacterium]